MRDLPHLASLIFNRPLLVRSDIGRQLIDAIGHRVLRGEALNRAEVVVEANRTQIEARAAGSRRLAGGAYLDRDGIAVLPILGSLVRRGTWLDAECGLMSYGLITNAATEILLDSSVRGLMLEIDSGGGEANGCFDAADFIRSASVATGKPVWAHANEIMCSAAYALGSSGAQVWGARTCEVGSIGVLGAHVDVSERDKMDGVKWTYIFSGDHKAEGNSHEPLSDGARSRMQADCDNLYEMFLSMVSQNRGMTTEEIRATNADIYRGTLAVDAGLIDEVGTLDEALEAFAESIDETQTPGATRLSGSQLRVGLMAPRNAPKTAETTKPDEEEGKVAATGAEVTDDEEDTDAGKTAATGDDVEDKKVAAIVERRLQAETDRCAGLHAVAEQASRLGVTFNAVEAIKKGMSVHDARAKVLAAASDGDADETSGIAVPKNKAGKTGESKTMSAEDKRAAWKKGLKRR